MGSSLSRETFTLFLFLFTLFSLSSCSSTLKKSFVVEDSLKRAPPADARLTNNKITSRQYTTERN